MENPAVIPDKKTAGKRRIALLFIFIGALLFWIITDNKPKQPEPLYWVSSMDPNYRSSGPGQCPHGMDLVPVYAEHTTTFSTTGGVVTITPQVQQQMGVRKARAKHGVLRQHLRAYGHVIPDRSLVTKIRPRVKGWIDMLFVHANGEAVKKGQPLFALYSEDLIAAQDRFLSALKTGNAAAILRTESHLRAINMDDQAIDQLKSEGVPQRSVIFRAPKDGMIDMLKISEGDYVRPKDTLLAIGSMERVWVSLEVFAGQASQIKPGQPLTFTTSAHPGLVWEGEIDSLHPHLDSQSGGLRFRAEIDNTRMLLRPNMQVEAFIALPSRAPKLLIPRAAVINLGEHNRVVLDVGDGGFKSVLVRPGESNGDDIEILDGLQEDDVVVTSAHFLIDSESSRTSDFLRMEATEIAAPEYSPTWVHATIKGIYPQERKLRLQHEHVTDWKMPGMTMNFKVTDTVDMRLLKVGQYLHFYIADGEPLFQVLDIQPPEPGKAP